MFERMHKDVHGEGIQAFAVIDNTYNLSIEDQPPTLNIFGKMWIPYAPSQTRLSNALGHDESIWFDMISK